MHCVSMRTYAYMHHRTFPPLPTPKISHRYLKDSVSLILVNSNITCLKKIEISNMLQAMGMAPKCSRISINGPIILLRII